MFLVARAENFARSNKLSLISLSPNASGTGVFTVASPNSNVDRVLTLPDETGTVDTLQRSGNVIQVVNATTATIVTNSTNTLANTGLTATITPTSASNKILVMVFQNGCSKTNNNYLEIQLYRDAGIIHKIGGAAAYTDSAAQNRIGTVGGTFLDSPATTSATTYKTMFMTPANGSGVTVQDNSATSSMILMEVTP